MTCNGCVRSVTNILITQEGVENAEVSLEKAQASVTFDPQKIDLTRLRSAIEDAGYEAQ